MPARKRTNFVAGTLSASITNVATTISGAGLAALPVIASPDYAILALDPDASAGAPELVKVTAHSSGATTATITRAQESTSARAHASGVAFRQVVTSTDWSLIETAENVKAHGAVGDDSTDDTTAFGLAQDAAGSGGTVFVPDGTYQVTGLALSSSDQRWVLSKKAVIKRRASSASTVVTISASGVEFEGGTIDGNKAAAGTGVYGIKVTADHCKVLRTYVKDTKNYGIYGENVSNFDIHFNRVTDSDNIGIFVQTTAAGNATDADCSIIGNRVDRSSLGAGITAGAIHVHGTDPSKVYRTRIIGNTTALPTSPTGTDPIGIEVWGDTTSGGSAYSVISGNTTVGGAMGISVAASPYSAVTGNTILGPDTFGIELAVSDFCSVVGNTVNGNALPTKLIVVDQSRHCVVEGNVCDAPASGGTGIFVGSSTSTDATCNTVVANKIKFTGAGKGIWLQSNHASADVSRCIVWGNQIEGDSTASSDGIQLSLDAGALDGTLVGGNSFLNVENGHTQGSDTNTRFYGATYSGVTNAYAGSTGSGRRILDTSAGVAEFGVASLSSAGNLNLNGYIAIGSTTVWRYGTGTPEGAITAPVGSIFSRTDGGAGTTFYVKESGAGNTGWVAK